GRKLSTDLPKHVKKDIPTRSCYRSIFKNITGSRL
ncbi:hypothetical protein CDAR_20341, partial [Caerostris darwini]